MPKRDQTPQVPEVVERFVKQLVVTHKAVGLYPSTSAIPRENVSIAMGFLRALLQSRGDVRLGVTKEGLLYELAPVFPEQAPYIAFALEMYNRNLSEIRFHAGLTDRDLLTFCEVLRMSPNDLIAAGGFESQLWERQIDAITVTEATTRIVESDGPAEGAAALPPGEPWPPDGQRIDEILVGAFGGRPRDQRLLVRIIQSPGIVRDYLHGSLSSRGSRPAAAHVASHLASLAHVVKGELPGDQPELYRSLAEAILQLDPELRLEVMRDKLLTDARKDEALAAVVRSMRAEEICDILIEGLAEGESNVEGVSRAIRNLALISLAGREEVIQAAGGAMAAAGVDPGTAASVLESATPSRLQVRERPKAGDDDPTDNIIRLVDLAPAQRAGAEDPSIEPLRAEARAGITDADIMGSLVTLVTLDVRPQPFAAIMSIIEDNLGLLLERDEFAAAADAAAALLEAERDRRLSTAQRRRIRNALSSLARTEKMRVVSRAMRLYGQGTPEHSACRRLLEILGQHALEPLLEVLGEEQDMATRKAMVDLISDVAPAHIAVLGERLADRRWYFVRNVVAILGNTRTPEALPHLERTLRHSDARVRRETIRAVTLIRDPRAEQMLGAALADDDPQNVTLAARYLGASGSRNAAAALEVVARGEGSGNREVGPRVEAIEALGRLGQVSSVPVLRQLASPRGLFRREPREVTAAAQAAVARIRPPKGGASS